VQRFGGAAAVVLELPCAVQRGVWAGRWAGADEPLDRDPEGRDGAAFITGGRRARSCKRARWAARRRRSCRPRSRSGRAATSSRRTCTPSPSAATSGTTPTSGPPPAAPASRRAAAPHARPRTPHAVHGLLQSLGGRAPAPGACADLRGSAAQHKPAGRASVPHLPAQSLERAWTAGGPAGGRSTLRPSEIRGWCSGWGHPGACLRRRWASRWACRAWRRRPRSGTAATAASAWAAASASTCRCTSRRAPAPALPSVMQPVINSTSAASCHGRPARPARGGGVARLGRPRVRAQVKHRCHCADEAVCGAEAAMVERLAAEGLLTPNNGALDPGARPPPNPTLPYPKPAFRRNSRAGRAPSRPAGCGRRARERRQSRPG